MKSGVVIFSIIVVGLAVGGYIFLNGEQEEPIRYRTALVERGTIESVVSATGTINPVVSVQVGTQVSGMIKSLHADFNTRVKAGQVVAVIDPEPFKARREQAASNLEMARAAAAKARVDLAQRQRELERLKALLESQFVSQNEVDVAIANYESAQAQVRLADAQVRQAQAALDAAELELKYTVIRSPVDGIVVARNVEVGQTVAASFSTPNLFLIALDLTKMQVDTYVSESDIGEITEGMGATFTVDAYPGAQFHGVIQQMRLAPVTVQNVVTYNVVVEVDNQDLRLRPGMTANVAIVVARKDGVLKVPNAALRFRPPQKDRVEYTEQRGRSFSGGQSAKSGGTTSSLLEQGKMVWKVGADGEPEAMMVRTGISDGSWTEIVEGAVREGDLVIVGIERPRQDRKTSELPPGFGGGRRSR
ncbi:MAG: efflux RND transporter periplasmic adaptor subunit [Nitrospira sp.]|nr:efflux RND transporter periplasmic adaptor subunit [Nitrospira sp.]